MSDMLTRSQMILQLRAVAERDERIMGLLDYGSSSEERADEWSDIDVAFFIRDEDLTYFHTEWRVWVQQFGQVLLAFPGVAEHPWTIYAAQPVPLRVDFAFHAVSAIEDILAWPNSPSSVEAMLWCDKTDGLLKATVQKLIGRSLAPDDEAKTFEGTCGGFWYYLLYAYSKLRHGDHWFARESFNLYALGNLVALLKFEAGFFERWQASSAAWRIERVITPQREAQLKQCIAGPGVEGLRTAFIASVQLGREVCEHIAQERGWSWPEQLADDVTALFDEMPGNWLF
jgi:hypothetical protein